MQLTNLLHQCCLSYWPFPMFHKRTLKFNSRISAWTSILITFLEVDVYIFCMHFLVHKRQQILCFSSSQETVFIKYHFTTLCCLWLPDKRVSGIKWALKRRHGSHKLAFIWSEVCLMTLRKADIELQLFSAISVLNLVTTNPSCSNSHLSCFKWLLNWDYFVFIGHLQWSTENKTAHL